MGLILSLYDGSECYKQFAWSEGRSHRDFMYNVTYEAIAYAYKKWGASRIGITHSSRSKFQSRYQPEVTKCQFEAMAHFCGEHNGMEGFTFLDDCEGNQPLQIVKEFNEMTDVGWLTFYNHRKLHSTLGYISPMQFENNWLAAR